MLGRLADVTIMIPLFLFGFHWLYWNEWVAIRFSFVTCDSQGSCEWCTLVSCVPSLPLFLLLWARTWFWNWKWQLTAWGHGLHFKVPGTEQKQTLGTLETPWSQSTYKKELIPCFVILRRQATHFNSGNSICWSPKHGEQLCLLKPTWLSGWMDTTHPDLHKFP